MIGTRITAHWNLSAGREDDSMGNLHDVVEDILCCEPPQLATGAGANTAIVTGPVPQGVVRVIIAATGLSTTNGSACMTLTVSNATTGGYVIAAVNRVVVASNEYTYCQINQWCYLWPGQYLLAADRRAAGNAVAGHALYVDVPLTRVMGKNVFKATRRG